MADKTNPKDAAGWARVIQALKEQGHNYPHAYIARHVKVSRQSVRLWRAVPPKYVSQISELCGIPKDKILPAKFKELLG